LSSGVIHEFDKTKAMNDVIKWVGELKCCLEVFL
jgi:hypothetical protein